jgi:hypothetical protein
VAAYFGAVFSLDAVTGDGNLQGWLGLGYSFLLGVLVGRRWALGVPVAGAIGVGIYAAITRDADCATCEDDVSVGGAIFILVLLVCLAEIGIAAGVLAGRVVGGWLSPS